MPKLRFRHPFIALMLLVSMLCQGTWALAGTTGALTGTVVLAESNSPIAGAKVTAASPSQVATATTDAQGHFAFVSLAPDAYTVSVEKEGYQSVSQTGIAVFADNTQTVTISLLKVIGKVTTRAASALVKPGTTADVYSVNAGTADKITALGGGGGLNTAYSAIASVPGVYVPVNQQGWFQSVFIRGGDYDQVGYETDGVPVNRSFDNYPATTASALGQQELQVYTGSAPANAESQGLSGFVNQVIRTGTYPGFASLDLGIGGPTFYHKANFEIGGANPSRNFSYYIGVGGYNQDYRYYDQNNGASISGTYGSAFDVAPCPATPSAGFAACYKITQNNGALPAYGPGGYVLGPFQMGAQSHIADRENVVNLHFGLPHRRDSGKDDIQLLVNASTLYTWWYSSAADWGLPLYTADQHGCLLGDCTAGPIDPTLSASLPAYFGGYQYNGALNTALPSNYKSLTTVYQYPSSNAAPFATIPSTTRDAYINNQGLVKLQYQHNIGSAAYFRIYGYSYYSDWLNYGPQTTNANYVGCCPPDYELDTHTRGVSANFADQINAKNLLNVQASLVHATTVRDNNTQMLDFAGSRSRFAVAVDSNNPLNGLCYSVSGGVGTPTTCNPAAPSSARATFATLGQAASGTVAPLSGTCGTGPCTYWVVEGGPTATYNTVTPTFTSFAVTDQFKPSDRLLLDLGLRYDNYSYKGSDTTGGARTFWFNAWNQDECVLNAPGSRPVDKVTDLGLSPTAPCPAGYVPATLTNASAPTYSFGNWEPRIGLTYTMNPDTVLRLSYGKYTQAPNAAFEQYNTLQQNLPWFIGPRFYQYGFTTPGHDLPPSLSYNLDASLEHHIKGTDISFKLTPFYRKTRDQYQQFYLDQKTAFVSGLPVGNLTAEGAEFQLNKGNFNENGLAWQLAYTYTHAYINYSTLPGGSTVLTSINNDIKTYNAYTSFCATHPTDARCGTPTSGAVSAACYTPAGAPDPACAAGDIANPYWNAPVQNLFDPSANYSVYDIFPAGISTSTNSYEVPHVATLVVNYKHNRWSFTPSLQFQSGQRYGAPEVWPGIDPAAGCSPLAGSTAGDPRYQFGAAGGAPYDATTCAGALNAIPDPYTGKFDNLGSFRAPSQLLGHLQISYEASPRVTFQLTMANLINTCFGGDKPAWAVSNNKVCGYTTAGILGSSGIFPMGNFYNPGVTPQPFVQYPYIPIFGAYNADGNSTAQPLNVYFDVKIKL